MYQGSCLCGKVSYEITGEPGPIGVCHCRNCRKANGSAFNAIVPVNAANFRLLSAETLTKYESSPGVGRYFCSNCGSPIYSQRDAMPELLRVRIGTLDSSLEGKPAMHIFVGMKAPWYDIHDTAPQYAERPPA
ncbi:MAG TPA: GFA family protein [Povalibacter sp.]